MSEQDIWDAKAKRLLQSIKMYNAGPSVIASALKRAHNEGIQDAIDGVELLLKAITASKDQTSADVVRIIRYYLRQRLVV